MALVACQECNREVSDRASACPHCGNPMAARAQPATTGPLAVETAPGKAVTTEATGKTYKAMQFGGVVMILIGVVACSAQSPGASASLWLVGVCLYVGGRVGGWWNHG